MGSIEERDKPGKKGKKDSMKIKTKGNGAMAGFPGGAKKQEETKPAARYNAAGSLARWMWQQSKTNFYEILTNTFATTKSITQKR